MFPSFSDIASDTSEFTDREVFLSLLHTHTHMQMDELLADLNALFSKQPDRQENANTFKCFY